MSDAAIKAKTGKDWAGWFAALDKAGAAGMPPGKAGMDQPPPSTQAVRGSSVL